MSDTVDFGAPKEFGVHHFFVEIPVEPKAAVSIYEDFGFNGDETKRETTERRVILARELWTKIKDDARRDFNKRLKDKKQSTGTWNTGKVKLDRFLGRELCVLAGLPNMPHSKSAQLSARSGSCCALKSDGGFIRKLF